MFYSNNCSFLSRAFCFFYQAQDTGGAGDGILNDIVDNHEFQDEADEITDEEPDFVSETQKSENYFDKEDDVMADLPSKLTKNTPKTEKVCFFICFQLRFS